VRFGGEPLPGWQIFLLPFESAPTVPFQPGDGDAPALHRGTFELAHPGDTYLDASELGKGILFVNGRNAGRYWRIGPQQSLYVPGAWLRSGRNEIVIFDVMSLSGPSIGGVGEPIIHS